MKGLLKHLENLKADYSHVPAGPPDPSQLIATASKAESAQESVLSGPGSGSFPGDSSGQSGYYQNSCSQTPTLLANPQHVDLDRTRPLQALAATTKTRKAASTQGIRLSALVPESTLFNLAGQPEYHKSLCFQINEGWKKLDHYYELTDQSTVYVTALILHPAFTWEYLESIWRSKANWIAHHKRKINGQLVGSRPPKKVEEGATIPLRLAFGDVGGPTGKYWANSSIRGKGEGEVQEW